MFSSFNSTSGYGQSLCLFGRGKVDYPDYGTCLIFATAMQAHGSLQLACHLPPPNTDVYAGR